MKTIVAIFFALGMLLSSLVSEAQSKSDKMYSACDNRDVVLNFSLTKNTTDAFNVNLSDGDQKNVISNLYQVKFVSFFMNSGKDDQI